MPNEGGHTVETGVEARAGVQSTLAVLIVR
jgi:hypothetical protein